MNYGFPYLRHHQLYQVARLSATTGAGMSLILCWIQRIFFVKVQVEFQLNVLILVRHWYKLKYNVKNRGFEKSERTNLAIPYILINRLYSLRRLIPSIPPFQFIRRYPASQPPKRFSLIHRSLCSLLVLTSLSKQHTTLPNWDSGWTRTR